MREQIGLLNFFKDCKNTNPTDFSKFNNSAEKSKTLCKTNALKAYYIYS